ncbi:MAG: hypothetical protein Q8N38_10185, partial [Bacteroidales bacterium]|nr:hypothetical protein [Bacteroidales bacterium]
SAGNLSYEHRKAIRFNLLFTIQNIIELYSLKEKANIDFILYKVYFVITHIVCIFAKIKNTNLWGEKYYKLKVIVQIK